MVRIKRKKTLVLGLFLVVVLVGLVLQSNQTGREYLSWLKTEISEFPPVNFARQLFSKFSPFRAVFGPETLIFEDSGLDLSEIDFEALISKEKLTPEQEQDLIEEEAVIAPEVKSVSEDSPALAEIQEKINEITAEVERISQEVERLVALTEIQDKIAEIADNIERLGGRIRTVVN